MNNEQGIMNNEVRPAKWNNAHQIIILLFYEAGFGTLVYLLLRRTFHRLAPHRQWNISHNATVALARSGTKYRVKSFMLYTIIPNNGI